MLPRAPPREVEDTCFVGERTEQRECATHVYLLLDPILEVRHKASLLGMLVSECAALPKQVINYWAGGVRFACWASKVR